MSVSRIARRLLACAALTGAAVAAISGCGGGGNSTSIITTPVTGNFVTPGKTPFTSGDFSSRGVCTTNAHVGNRARWTVLVYMNAASNLQPDSLLNVAQMASVGSNADLNIVLQWKQTGSPSKFTAVTPETYPSFIGTRRYLIQKHSQADLNKIAPPGVEQDDVTTSDAAANTADTSVLEGAGERLPDPATNTLTDSGFTSTSKNKTVSGSTSDMGSYRTLADFVQWGSQQYPADHLAVVVWDHGSAALNVDNRSARQSRSALKSRAAKVRSNVRSVSQDTQTGSQIATWELPLGMTAAQPIDMIVIDCSLEGTTEVAYDLRKSARVFVGTEESPPGQGYPYDAWLSYLQQNTAGPCDSGNNLINDTVAFYAGDQNATNVTQSMTDLSKMDALASAVNAFGGSLRTYVGSQGNLIYTSRDKAQNFEYYDFKDLYHFSDIVRSTSGVPTDLAQAAANVENALLGSGGAILESQHAQRIGSEGYLHTYDNVVNNPVVLTDIYASGLSIYLPDLNPNGSLATGAVGYDSQYNNTGFSKAAPNWVSFLQSQTR